MDQLIPLHSLGEKVSLRERERVSVSSSDLCFQPLTVWVNIFFVSLSIEAPSLSLQSFTIITQFILTGPRGRWHWVTFHYSPWQWIFGGANAFASAFTFAFSFGCLTSWLKEGKNISSQLFIKFYEVSLFYWIFFIKFFKKIFLYL